jgi:hypothetical protein
LLVADFCANPQVVRAFLQRGAEVRFVTSGHPLCGLLEKCAPPASAANAQHRAVKVTPMAGTVALSALDWAVREGFREVRVLGADFAYQGGRPYCRGTYLEDRFHGESGRLATAEGAYTALLFRSPTYRHGDRVRTALLDSYRAGALAQGARYSGVTLEWVPPLEEAPFLPEGPRGVAAPALGEGGFLLPPGRDFLAWYAARLETYAEGEKGNVTEVDRDILYSCLPLGAWAQSRGLSGSEEKSEKNEIFSLIDLAFHAVVGYT